MVLAGDRTSGVILKYAGGRQPGKSNRALGQPKLWT